MSNITRPLKSWPLLGRRFSSHPHADDQNLVKRRRFHRRFWTRTCFSSHVEPHFKCEIHQACAGRAVSPPKSRSQPLATEGSGKVVARPKSRRHGGLGASHAAALATVVFLLQRPLHLPVAHAQVAVELRTGALVCPAAPILPRLRPVLATRRALVRWPPGGDVPIGEACVAVEECRRRGWRTAPLRLVLRACAEVATCGQATQHQACLARDQSPCHSSKPSLPQTL